MPPNQQRQSTEGNNLGQTNYAEICRPILVTKYISKLNKIQITCHVFNYVFQILAFQLLDNSANKHAEQPRFFSCFTSGSCTSAKYTKLCMVWQRNVRICCELSGGGASPSPEPAYRGLCLWTPLGDFRPRPPVPPMSLNPGYATGHQQ